MHTYKQEKEQFYFRTTYKESSFGKLQLFLEQEHDISQPHPIRRNVELRAIVHTDKMIY